VLLNAETQNLIDRLIDEGLSRYSSFAIGQSLARLNPIGIGSGPNDAVLVQAYLAGKVAAVVGVDNARRMTVPQLQSVIHQRGVVLTNFDRELLSHLMVETEQWLSGRADAAKAKFKEKVLALDQQYRGELTNLDSQEGIGNLRDSFLSDLEDELGTFAVGVAGDIDRVNQTQMAGFFQTAYVSGAAADTVIWKLPRTTAEKHCLRIYLNPDGSPRTERLGKVRGRTNIGKPASAWQFVVGPTHPHCYCILYTSDDKKPLGSSGSRARAFGAAVNPSEAGIGRLQRAADTGKITECCEPGEVPGHIKTTISAVKAEYGEDSPAR